MTKQEYILESKSKDLQMWNSIGAVLGVGCWILFAIVDYYQRDGNLAKTLTIRAVIITICLIILYLNNIKRSIPYQHWMVAIVVVTSSIANQAIALITAGANSPYYVGLIIIMIVGVALIPVGIYIAVVLCTVIWVIYLVPIMGFYDIPSYADFLSNNFYIFFTICISLTLRFVSNKSITNELSLQYDLQNERDHLDMLVQERSKELKKSEQWHRSIIENSSDGVLIMKKNGVIVNVNDMACKIYQTDREKLVGVIAGELFNKDHKCNMARIFPDILRGPSAVFEIPCKEANGKATFLEISVQHLTIGDDGYILTISRDITERKMYQEQLVHNQKMDSIAAFAGGISHDVRNIITSMIAYIEIVKNDKGVSERTLSRTNLLDKSIQNAGNMISQLLNFAKKSKSAVAESSLNDVVRDTLNIITASIGENIEIWDDLWHQNLVVQINTNQIETVIMNIIFNARDAMPNGGQIAIKTEAVRISGKTDAPKISNIAHGKYAVLSIRDTGCGIPEEMRERIFEPFYTAQKEHGTGLGLAMAHSIVSEHEGYITVESEVGKGSLFKIYIPLVAEQKTSSDMGIQAYHKSAAESIPRRYDARSSDSGSILFVDDDPVLLTMMSDALEARGYSVITTSNPQEAASLVQKDMGKINLLITDMAMPKMNGSELIQHVRSMRPNMKVIMISAFNQETIEKMLGGIKTSAVLRKPFAPDEFLNTVRSVVGPF